MKKILLGVLVLILLSSFVLGKTYTGDGIYTAKEGDILTADNGHGVTLGQISWALSGDTIPQILITYNYGGSTSIHEDESLKLGYGPYGDKYFYIEVVSIDKDALTTQIKIRSIEELGERPPEVRLPGEIAEPEDDNYETYSTEGKYNLKPKDEILLRDGYVLKYVSFQETANRVDRLSGKSSQVSTSMLALYPPNSDTTKFAFDKVSETFSVDSEGVGSTFYTVSQGFSFRATGLNPTTKEVSIEVFSGMAINLREGWNLISPSFEAINCDIGKCYEQGGSKINVRENTCDDFDKLVFWRYDSESNEYIESVPVPPYGYWVKSDKACSMVFAGKPASINNLKLNKGWNIIGGPGILNPPWDINTNKGDCVITRGPWRFTGSWEKTFTIFSMEGHFIKVENDCRLGGN